MAKLAFIVTPDIEATEVYLAQLYTKAIFIKDLDQLNDGDVAIISDQSFDARAIMSLEVSAHILMVSNDKTFNRVALQDLIECDLIVVKDNAFFTQVMRPDDQDFFEIDASEESKYIEAFLNE